MILENRDDQDEDPTKMTEEEKQSMDFWPQGHPQDIREKLNIKAPLSPLPLTPPLPQNKQKNRRYSNSWPK